MCRLSLPVVIVVWFELVDAVRLGDTPVRVRLYSSALLFPMTMDPDRSGQISEFFGGVEPSNDASMMGTPGGTKRPGDVRGGQNKAQRPLQDNRAKGSNNGKGGGKGGGGKAQRDKGRRKPWNPQEWEDSEQSEQTEYMEHRLNEMQNTLRTVTRALLNHEDALRVLRLDTGLVWFAQVEGDNNRESIIPFLRGAALKWSSKECPEMSKRPLREVMFLGILQRLQTKLHDVQQDAALTLRCQQQGWYTQDKKWVFQKWCKETQTLVQDTTKIPVAHSTLVTSIRNMLQMVDQGPVLNRFCSTRRLDQYEAGVAVFLQDLSLRDPNGTKVYEGLMDYQGCTAWQLIGMQYRRETLQRTPVVQTLKKLLDER